MRSFKQAGGLFLAIAALLCMQSLPGCSKTKTTPGAKVEGKVTYKNAPVTGGEIAFHAKKGGVPYKGVLNPDGTFSFPSVPILGDVVVTVDTESMKNADDPMAKMIEMMKARGAPEEEIKKLQDKMKGQGIPDKSTMKTGTYVKIPAKYSDPKTSTLTCTLKEGAQSQDFSLTD
jgi:hypothetical protein